VCERKRGYYIDIFLCMHCNCEDMLLFMCYNYVDMLVLPPCNCVDMWLYTHGDTRYTLNCADTEKRNVILSGWALVRLL
jgi:hypothetical protein